MNKENAQAFYNPEKNRTIYFEIVPPDNYVEFETIDQNYSGISRPFKTRQDAQSFIDSFRFTEGFVQEVKRENT